MLLNNRNYITTTEVAKILGFTPDHVRRLILQGKIKAKKLGHAWIMRPRDFKHIKRKRFPRIKDEANHGSD